MKPESYLLQRIEKLKAQIYALYLSIRDPDVHWFVRVFALMILAYIISPIDIIPDFVPVFGLMDEIILVPLAILLLKRMIPADIQEKHQARQQQVIDRPLQITGMIITVMIWISMIILACVFWPK